MTVWSLPLPRVTVQPVSVHEGMPLHDELSEFASAHGYEIAWDGLTVELAL